jgi:hypothetical protein
MSFEAKCRTVLHIYQVGFDQPSQEVKIPYQLQVGL